MSADSSTKRYFEFLSCLGGVVGYYASLTHTKGPQFEPGLRHFVIYIFIFSLQHSYFRYEC